MKTNRWTVLAIASFLLISSTGPASAVDGVLNFDDEASEPVFLKACGVFGEQTVSGVEIYENDRLAAASSVELVPATADGDPDFGAAVALTASGQLEDGWMRYLAASPVRATDRVWVKVTYASGRSEFAASTGAGPAIGYSIAGSPVQAPQLVSSDGGETFDRLDPHLNLAANLLLEGAPGISTMMAMEQTPQSDPLANRMLSAHPNPFNPRTEVSFRVETAGHIQLRVFDVRGRLVETLLDEYRGSGRHEAVWDASGGALASGVYFVTLDGPQGRFVQRVALVR